MRDGSVPPVRLDEYRPPAYWVSQLSLTVELDPHRTRVRARLELRRNPGAARNADLVLDGQGLILRSLKVNGYVLRPSEYTLDGAHLTLPAQPDAVVLETEVEINPAANTALEGLYLSNGRYCTQCEAEGFRRITFFPDRPDVLAKFTTTLIADPGACPVLLGNGDEVESGTLADGRHWARFDDPVPKPCYLFALVAGEFAILEDRFVTTSGRDVRLAIHTEPAFASQTAHAMAALKASMAWDEREYGREYDLSVYHIVAVSDFNMGAMENKGLNVFNTRYVLADPESATDQDYQHIEAVIAHEYFHNWTGNRVTCRDWFQLSLKEGLTVFRDQQFSAAVGSAAVKRIGDVRLLRTVQFAEDASPLAHPVRPDSYIEINNFYTATVYNKGAEVVRMLHTLLGPQRFRAGMDRYFDRHDGEAVTVEDFLAAHQSASGEDLTQFHRWYTQAGTPQLSARGSYDAGARRYTLRLAQHTPATPGQSGKLPLHIPVALGLLDADGRELPLRLAGEPQAAGTTRVLQLTQAEAEFVFEDVPAPPVPSLLRGFSAPVRLEAALEDADLAHLAAHDTDSWCRYDAVQQLYLRTLMPALALDGAPLRMTEVLRDAVLALLQDTRADPALIAEMLILPSEQYLAGEAQPVDPARVHATRLGLRVALAQALREAFVERYEALAPRGAYRPEASEVARRSLRSVCLAYLGELEGGAERAYGAYTRADNMTDAMAALGTLVHLPGVEREAALADFAARHAQQPLVMDKWFALQAGARTADTPDRVQELMASPGYQRLNPNRVRALLGTYTQANPLHFHAPDGSGYALLEAELMVLDTQNPQLAARMAAPLVRWRRFEPARAALMQATLTRLAARPDLSSDIYEVVSKALA